jgi:hypothetical protein
MACGKGNWNIRQTIRCSKNKNVGKPNQTSENLTHFKIEPGIRLKTYHIINRYIAAYCNYFYKAIF